MLGGLCGIIALIWQFQEYRLGRAEIVIAEPAAPVFDSAGNLKLRVDLTNLSERTVYVRSLVLNEYPADDQRVESRNNPRQIVFTTDTLVAIEPGSFVRFVGPPTDLVRILEMEQQETASLTYRTTRKQFNWRANNILRNDTDIVLQQVIGGRVPWSSVDAFRRYDKLTKRLLEECKAEDVPADDPKDLSRRGLVQIWVFSGQPAREFNLNSLDAAFVLSDSLKRMWSPRQQICWMAKNTASYRGRVKLGISK